MGNQWRDRWQDRWFTGHISLGPVTIYGANAMHWEINIRTRWGFVCLHPTTRTFGCRWPWYFRVSPDATPQAATFDLRRALAGEEKGGG